MAILFEKSIFAMIGTIENAIIELAEHLNIPCEDGEKFGVIHQRLLDACPKLHTREELQKLGQEFVQDFINKFNHNQLRIWYECTAPMTFSDEMLMRKYRNLLKNHDKWVGEWLTKHDVILRVDAFLLGNEVKKAYHKCGVDFDAESEWTLQLWGLLKTIHDSFYDEKLIDALQESIILLLEVTGGEHYTTLDLTNRGVLKELYYVLCEVNHTNDGFKGHEMFHYYDGNGNTVFELTGELIDEW